MALSFSPVDALKESVAVVPEVKYALGITGLAAAVAIVLGFVSDVRIAVFGVIIILALMYLLAIFAQVLANIPGLRWLAGFLVWSIALLFITVLILVFTSFAFGRPEILANRLFGSVPIKTNEVPGVKGTEVGVGFPQPIRFDQAIQIINDEYNVTIFFGANCDDSVKSATVQPNTTHGQDMKDYIEKLRQRIQRRQGGLLNYTVRSEGASHEIICQ